MHQYTHLSATEFSSTVESQSTGSSVVSCFAPASIQPPAGCGAQSLESVEHGRSYKHDTNISTSQFLSNSPHGNSGPHGSPHGTQPPKLHGTQIPMPHGLDVIVQKMLEATHSMSTAGLSTSTGNATNSSSRTCHFCSPLFSTPPAPCFRCAPSSATTRRMAVAALARLDLWESIRIRRIERALRAVGLTLSACDSGEDQSSSEGLNKALQSTLSEFVRRTRLPLPQFAELLRGQTEDDYRPNKGMIPAVLSATCAGYEHLPQLLSIAEAAAQVPLSQPLPPQQCRPRNHGSADEGYAVLVQNIRKEQDAWRCIVADTDLLSIWTEVHISPFGVVDKGDGDRATTGRVIHDIPHPVNHSINDFTDQAEVCQPDFIHCDAIATETARQEVQFPGVDIAVQAGDVASAFKHVCIHSNSVHLFGRCLDRNTALVIDMSAAFGWSGSPGNYSMVGGAIAHIHGHTTNTHNPTGFFNYCWVDDHINVAADVGSNCQDAEQSLRYAMLTVLGPRAINEDKFTHWSTRQKVLGLIFDTSRALFPCQQPRSRKPNVS